MPDAQRSIRTLRPPDADPAPGASEPWARFALDYLATELRGHAPAVLGPAAFFPRSPLEGEGPIAILPFVAAPGGGERGDYYVVVGRTEPTYFPAWSLNPDDAYSLHLGTRFMLVLGVAQAAPAEAAVHDSGPAVQRLVAAVAPGEPVDDVALAALFCVGDQRHAVYRCRIAGEPVYLVGGDCPPGFHRRSALPPHVVYRLHIGGLLRAEFDEDEREAARLQRAGRAAEGGEQA